MHSNLNNCKSWEAIKRRGRSGDLPRKGLYYNIVWDGIVYSVIKISGEINTVGLNVQGDGTAR